MVDVLTYIGLGIGFLVLFGPKIVVFIKKTIEESPPVSQLSNGRTDVKPSQVKSFGLSDNSINTAIQLAKELPPSGRKCLVQEVIPSLIEKEINEK